MTQLLSILTISQAGIDADTLNELKEDHAVVATLEDGYLEGGFGAKIAAYYGSSDMKVLNFGIKKEFSTDTMSQKY